MPHQAVSQGSPCDVHGSDVSTIEWSDSWIDEDLADATAAAVRRFEDEEPGER